MEQIGRTLQTTGYTHRLEEAVYLDHMQMWPTPAARDWKSGRGRQENGHTPQLPEVMGGQLNPLFVEWLMGYPEGWTDLKDLETP